jgi:hypothetical protein
MQDSVDSESIQACSGKAGMTMVPFTLSLATLSIIPSILNFTL